MKPERIDEHIPLEDQLRFCQHDDCRTRPTLLCTCGCERQLCELHEGEERAEWQVRMGLSLIKRRRPILELRRTRHERSVR